MMNNNIEAADKILRTIEYKDAGIILNQIKIIVGANRANISSLKIHEHAL